VQRYDPFDGGLGFALATRVGNLVDTSGMVGVDGDFNVPEDPAADFGKYSRTWRECSTRWGHRSSTSSKRRSSSLAISRRSSPVFEEVRKEVFAGHLSASTCVCVKRLLEERYRVEVKLVAAVPET